MCCWIWKHILSVNLEVKDYGYLETECLLHNGHKTIALFLFNIRPTFIERIFYKILYGNEWAFMLEFFWQIIVQ